MIDLGQIQEQLKQLQQVEANINEKLLNCAFRDELFRNPIETLKREGVVLPPDREQAILEFFQNAKVPPDANLRVASDLASTPGDLRAIRIGISIGIRF